MSLQSEDTEEQDKEVDLDAILESAELREDEKALRSFLLVAPVRASSFSEGPSSSWCT